MQHLTLPNSALQSATIQIGHGQGFSLRKIACLINRSPPTISQEVHRNRDLCGRYSARAALQQMSAWHQVCRSKRKLLPGSERFELMPHMLLAWPILGPRVRTFIASIETTHMVKKRLLTRAEGQDSFAAFQLYLRVF